MREHNSIAGPLLGGITEAGAPLVIISSSMSVADSISRPGARRKAAGHRAGWKLSFHVDEILAPEAGLEPALALLRRHGIEFADLRVVNGRDNWIRLDDAGVAALARQLKRHGIKVGALEMPLFRCSLRPGPAVAWSHCPGFSPDLTFRDHLWYLRRALDIADRLGADEIRCFAFWREHALDDVLGEVADRLGEAAALARAAGRVLHLQNDPTTLAGTGVELARILRAVNSRHLRAAFDLANSARLGGVPYPADYRALRRRLECGGHTLGSVQVRFQAIDVRSGWGGPSPDLGGPHVPFAPFYFWHQAELPVEGWAEFGGKRFILDGVRTFLPLEESIGIDHAAFFRALRRDGYDGRVSVDPGYFLPGVTPADRRQADANFRKTVPALRQFLGRIHAANPLRRR